MAPYKHQSGYKGGGKGKWSWNEYAFCSCGRYELAHKHILFCSKCDSKWPGSTNGDKVADVSNGANDKAAKGGGKGGAKGSTIL